MAAVVTPAAAAGELTTPGRVTFLKAPQTEHTHPNYTWNVSIGNACQHYKDQNAPARPRTTIWTVVFYWSIPIGDFSNR